MHRLLAPVALSALAAAVAGCDLAEPLITVGRSLDQPRLDRRLADESPLNQQSELPPQSASSDSSQPPSTVPQTLDESTGGAAGGCIVEWNPADAQQDMAIDGVVAASPTFDSTNNGVRATAGHVFGRHYFEVTVESTGVDNYNQIAVIAGDHPGEESSWFEEVGCSGDVGHCAGVGGYQAGDVISVMADLDAGRVDFAKNGRLVAVDEWQPRTIAVVPGSGPFFPGAVLSEQARVRANFGAEPFAFTPPEGFLAWSAGFAADDAGRCLSDAVVPVIAAPIAVQGEGASTYDAGRDDDVELVVLGVYESTGGSISVDVNRPGRYVLDLSSYTAVNWNVFAGEGVVIEAIRASGYEGAGVEADGVDSVVVTSAQGGGDYAGCAYAWPYNFGGCDTVSVVGSAEDATGLSLSMFAGAYHADAFVIGD